MLDSTTAEAAQGALLRRIAAQDSGALAEFYDQFAGVLFSTAVRILGDTHEAEEVIQDVFVQIWNKASAFDAALGAPFHWTLSITRNRCINRLRARQRHGRVFDVHFDAAEADAIASTESTRDALSGDELAAVRAAVNTLPKEQRQAIELSFFGGMTHLEIAAALNEPLGTIKARIRRGMTKLRDSLQAYV